MDIVLLSTRMQWMQCVYSCELEYYPRADVQSRSEQRERETARGELSLGVSAKRLRETYDTLLQTELPLVPLPSTSTRSEYREMYEKP